MDETDFPRIDRSAFDVRSVGDPSDEKRFWHGRSIEERLATLEYLRQLNYAYDPATTRLQRVLEIAQLPRS
jgi:hypothetical protein